MSRQTLFSGAILLILVAGSWWLAQNGSNEDITQEPVAHTPDYLLESFNTLTMDDTGKPKRGLTAKKMVHFPDDRSAQLIKPRLVFYEDAQPVWRVKSERGEILHDGEILVFQGDVKIDRDEAPDVLPIQIRTSELTVRPEINFAETSMDIDINSRSDWVQSKGMQVWFNEPVYIKLLAVVRGRYEVN